MPYEITATRKRPQTFEELAGQDFVSATLEASLERGQIAHAYLFSGPRGCGKTSTARILAKALNCERGPTATPCGVCRSCVEIARGASLDVIEIDGASNTSVDNVRQIKDEVLFPPNGGRYKVYIIDEVHMLSNSAFNALLKTIEEPPPYIVFIFATTELHKVPATIKSRCQQFAFRLIPIDIIKTLLAKAAEELGVSAEEDALLWIAKESSGSLRDAYTLFDQVISFSEGKLSAALIRDKLGLVGMDALNDLFRSCAAGEPGQALVALDGILERGVSVEQCTVDAVEYFRSLLLIKNGVDKAGLLGAPASAYDPVVVAAFSTEQLERALAGLLDLYRNLRLTVDPRFELELAIAALCRLRDYVSSGEVAAALAELRSRVAGESPSPPARSRGTAAVAAGGSPSGTLGERVEAEKKKPELHPSLVAAFDSLVAAAESEAPARSAGSPHIGDAKSAAEAAKPTAAPAYEDDDDESEDSGPGPDSPVGPGDAMSELKASVIERLGKSSPLIKTGLSASLPWRNEGDKLVIPFRSGMEESVVRARLGDIATAASSIAGRSFKVELRVEGTKSPTPRDVSDAEATGPVAVVERVFRGTRMPTAGGAEGEHNGLR
ncbi:MAG TPA: DNA polymerase III subunit gamma/tau [Rectinemataceae bacterium]|nr:DNA polymerase III subunit gamma/tau [Rectinemataceae bacterium]